MTIPITRAMTLGTEADSPEARKPISAIAKPYDRHVAPSCQTRPLSEAVRRDTAREPIANTAIGTTARPQGVSE